MAPRKKKEPKRHRMFNGEEYHQAGESGSSTKANAKERARRLKVNGYKTRIIPIQKKYFVFARRK